MFTPLDICIRLSSAINYSVRSKFTGRRTWSSVKDSREEEASINIMVADNAPSAFCTVEIECFKIRDGKKKLLIEAFVDMFLDDGYEIDLSKFPVEDAMKDIWSFYPSVTAGTRYNIEYSKERGPELVTKDNESQDGGILRRLCHEGAGRPEFRGRWRSNRRSCRRHERDILCCKKYHGLGEIGA